MTPTEKRAARIKWVAETLDVVGSMARYNFYLSTDDVWRELGLDRDPIERSWMGLVMATAAKNGLIVETKIILPSDHESHHGHPIRVWRSLVVAP